ncbi:peroxisomal membrane protein pex14 [Coemansia guatemalensis]|uniref:Peroxisomal membrane protein PEX14 n=1 Tax=Coemansia guatemalensis TaxID=2761395 RepID=A0A9W8HTP0_9FUNG|nr:peroxisomal membrane protein pex14 [Coemansia guatemalensis]
MSTESPPSDAAAQSLPPSQALREDIIESAVRFLSDPKVQSSTLAKKVSFLETKGLTNAEIEDALSRAKRAQAQAPISAQATEHSTNALTQSTAAPGYAQALRPPASPPPRPHLDWKDYFIAAVVAGGLGYGLFMLAKKYVAPLLAVRDDNKRLAEERKLLVEQNELTRKQLETLSESTAQVLDTLAMQSQKTSEAIEGMVSVMDSIATQGTEQRSLSSRLLVTLEDLQREVSALSSTTTAAREGSISDVQSDIRSLRSLLLSQRVPARSSSSAVRPPASPSQTMVGPAPGAGGSPDATSTSALSDVSELQNAAAATANTSRSAASTPTPTIPAWQLGQAEGSATENADKGKQVATE